MNLTVVIPTLNAEETIEATLANVVGENVAVIVVDGGSTDDTVVSAERMGARIVQTLPSRGLQMATGAACVQTEWMLFLHADTQLAENWKKEVDDFMEKPQHLERGAVFQFVLDCDVWQASCLEWLVAKRTRVLGLPYGDQGLLISKKLYCAVGGFRPIPLMEDVDVIRRIGRERLAQLPVRAVTSAKRWQQQGWIWRSLRNLLCLTLYAVGVTPHTLRRLYGA